MQLIKSLKNDKNSGANDSQVYTRNQGFKNVIFVSFSFLALDFCFRFVSEFGPFFPFRFVSFSNPVFFSFRFSNFFISFRFLTLNFFSFLNFFRFVSFSSPVVFLASYCFVSQFFLFLFVSWPLMFFSFSFVSFHFLNYRHHCGKAKNKLPPKSRM
jgi:hypothetical protein